MSYYDIIFNQEVLAALMCKQGRRQLLTTGNRWVNGWCLGSESEYVSIGSREVTCSWQRKAFLVEALRGPGLFIYFFCHQEVIYKRMERLYLMVGSPMGPGTCFLASSLVKGTCRMW